MGHRLSKITTRTGDAGETGLGDLSRVGKDHPRIVALGEIDELNCAIGTLLTEPLPVDINDLLIAVQHDLFDLGGALSVPGRASGSTEQSARLEQYVEHYNAELPPLKEFILPGGSRAAAFAHVARTVCRRAERAVVTLARSDAAAAADGRIYLNRLSDLLFVLARVLNRFAGRNDVQWQPAKRKTPSDAE
jgi:cob(I)alamin adenosyltransferase